MAVTPTRNDAPAKPARSGMGNAMAAGGRLEGRMHFTGPVIVGAHLSGEIDSDDLILVEATGRLEGRIRCATLIVHGSVSGDVEAGKSLEVCIGGRLEGSAFSPSMRVEERTHVSADLLIAPQRSAAHINRAGAARNRPDVAPIAQPRPDTPPAGAPRTAAG